MNYAVQLADQAKQDLDDIYSYIRNVLKSEINADSFLKRVYTSLEDLSFMPESYHLYPHEPWHSRGIRYFSVGNYSIFYHSDDKEHIVTVIHIIYGKRDINKII